MDGRNGRVQAGHTGHKPTEQNADQVILTAASAQNGTRGKGGSKQEVVREQALRKTGTAQTHACFESRKASRTSIGRRNDAVWMGEMDECRQVTQVTDRQSKTQIRSYSLKQARRMAHAAKAVAGKRLYESRHYVRQAQREPMHASKAGNPGNAPKYTTKNQQHHSQAMARQERKESKAGHTEHSHKVHAGRIGCNSIGMQVNRVTEKQVITQSIRTPKQVRGRAHAAGAGGKLHESKHYANAGTV